MSHELLNHPDVLKTIRAELLSGGYPKDEVEDGVREVVAETFEYLQTAGETIETVGRMQAIVRPMGYRRGVDALRAKYTKAKTIAGTTDKADSHVAPASSDEERLDMRRALETIEQNKEKHDGAIIESLGNGVSQKELAAKLRLSHDQARKETGSMRARHRKALQMAGYGGLLAGVLVFLAVIFRMHSGPDQEARPEPLPSPTGLPPGPAPGVPVTVQGPSSEAREKAKGLRARAHAEALKKDWDKCVADYADAEKLDPDGVSAEGDKESGDCADEYEKTLNSKPRGH